MNISSKVQNTVVSYKLKSSTHIDEITIVNHRRWNHLGKLVIDRTVKKKRRVSQTPSLSPNQILELALAK